MLEIGEKGNFILGDEIFLQKIEELGKYWVFNVDSGEHYSLNESSYWILEQVANNLPIADILSGFLAAFDIDEKQGENDFHEIIENFLKEGIITRRADNEKGREKDL